MGEHAHFKNFGMAFLTLFRIATGDNWNGIMKDALRDDCDPNDRCETNCCVDPILAPCYFVIFVLISQFVLVSLVGGGIFAKCNTTFSNIGECRGRSADEAPRGEQQKGRGFRE